MKKLLLNPRSQESYAQRCLASTCRPEVDLIAYASDSGRRLASVWMEQEAIRILSAVFCTPIHRQTKKNETYHGDPQKLGDS